MVSSNFAEELFMFNFIIPSVHASRSHSRQSGGIGKRSNAGAKAAAQLIKNAVASTSSSTIPTGFSLCRPSTSADGSPQPREKRRKSRSQSEMKDSDDDKSEEKEVERRNANNTRER
jgi:hypothetical protein